MPKKQQGWITFQSSDAERQILEQYCSQSQRSKTDVLRELVRGLASTFLPVMGQLPSCQGLGQAAFNENRQARHADLEKLIYHLEHHAMKVSARNALKGKITHINLGAVNAEVTLEIAPGLEITAIITKTSAETLNLAAGKEAYAVIKSSDVMIAVD